MDLVLEKASFYTGASRSFVVEEAKDAKATNDGARVFFTRRRAWLILPRAFWRVDD